jgi:Gpi18-like mannosyltransferase
LNDKIRAFPSTFIWFWQLKGMVLLVKLPSIFADLGIGYFIYLITKKLKFAILWLFNPIIWYNSAIWGQTDAIVNLLGLVSIFYILRKKLVASSLFLVLSILFKGSLAIFVPVLFVYAFLQKYRFKMWVKSGVVCALAVILVSIWFHPRIDLFVWLFNLYNQRILPGEIGYLTANAFNFWWLVDPGRVLDSTIYFGLPARIWGYLIALIGVGIVIFKLKKNKSEKTLFWSLAMTALITFLFLTRIHERYLYPFFPVGTILVSFMPEFIIPLLLLSGVNLLNLYHLFWAPSIPPLEALLKVDVFKRLLAVIDTATVGVGLALGKRIKL